GDGSNDLVIEPRDLCDLAVPTDNVMGKLAAVAVRDRSDDDAAVQMVVERNLGDLGEVAAGDKNVARRIGAKLVEIDALEKMLLLGGTFRPRIARVIEALAVCRPCETAAPGRILNARDDLAGVLAGGDVEYVDGPVLAASLGKTYCDPFSIRRRDE